VQRLLIERRCRSNAIVLGIVLDRSRGNGGVFMGSSGRRMEIEEVAEKTPELILKEALIPGLPLQPFQARKLAFGWAFRLRAQARRPGDDGALESLRCDRWIARRDQSFITDPRTGRCTA